jgi:predicted AlkP superfamily phosphohydrolase/phosphomutase
MSQSRLVLVGIDAASSALVREWAAAGDLPTIAGLLRSGSSPASHGMFSHLNLKPRTYDLEIGMYANRLPVPPFWTHLSGAGKRVAVIDAPFARPVRKLNGIQVTNWGRPRPMVLAAVVLAAAPNWEARETLR